MTGPRLPHPLDSTDREILTAVQKDGRISLTDLAAAAHLGISATRIRLQTLQERGVVTSYSAHVDAASLGLTLRAMVRLSVEGVQDAKVLEILEREHRIVRCLRVTGEICFMFEIVASDMAELERITRQLAELGTVTTDLIYEVILERPVPTA